MKNTDLKKFRTKLNKNKWKKKVDVDKFQNISAVTLHKGPAAVWEVSGPYRL